MDEVILLNEKITVYVENLKESTKNKRNNK